MLMNALLKTSAVIKPASILMAPLSVPATLDISWMKMKFPALVSNEYSISEFWQ